MNKLKINTPKLRYNFHIEIIDTKTNTGIFLDNASVNDYKKIRESLDKADTKILEYVDENN